MTEEELAAAMSRDAVDVRRRFAVVMENGGRSYGSSTTKTDTRDLILSVLRRGEKDTITIAEQIGKHRTATFSALTRMKDAGQVELVRSEYTGFGRPLNIWRLCE